MAGTIKLDGAQFLEKVNNEFKITNSELKLKSSGNTVVDSSGNAVLSESGGTVTLNADEANVGSNALVVDSSGNVTLAEDATINGLTIGQGAGSVSTNTAVGDSALASNTTGGSNTAHGYQTLYSNTTGSNNIAHGYQSLYSNTTGEYNTAVGRDALRSNDTGGYNTAHGTNALYSNSSGYNNTANGFQALGANTTGSNNTAHGRNALYSNSTGQYNTAVGRSALGNNTTGSGNIGIGFYNNSGFYVPVFNPTTDNNRIVMGHTSVTNAYVQVAWTVVSDERDKTQIAPVPHGLDFVNQLNPVQFKFRISRDSEETNGGKRYGFLAQEVLAIEGEDNVIVDTEDSEKLKMTNEELLPVMVKAMQEMSAKITALEAEISTLKGSQP